MFEKDEFQDSIPLKTSSTKTPYLDTFARDITQLAKEGKLDQIVGRDDEVLRLIQVLGRKKKNNPVIVGSAGVGKTAIVEKLANMIEKGESSFSLQGVRILELDMATLLAGTKLRGQFEERLKAIIEEAKANKHIIIFFDEIHTLVGAGEGSGTEASNILKPSLARGEIRCIGATTYDEYRTSIEKDAALERRFQKIVIEEPSRDETVFILEQVKKSYEEFHKVKYSSRIIELIVDISDKYIHNRNFPDKAIDILDEAGSNCFIKNAKVPPSVQKMEERLKKIEEEKNKAVLTKRYEIAQELKDEKDELLRELKKIKSDYAKKLDATRYEVTDDEIYSVISKMTGIPLSKLSKDESEWLGGLEPYLNSNIIGQSEAVAKISNSIIRNRLGLSKKRGTIGNILLVGSTGIGKTMIAEKLAEYLFNTRDSLIKVDMSEYSEKHTISRLIGSPPGYVGFDKGGGLTEKVRQKPYSVILLDEVEKANPDVLNFFLGVMDSGMTQDAAGRKISFKNTLIIMSSNIGVHKAQTKRVTVGYTKPSDSAEFNKVIQEEIKTKFSPEFLNRIDDVVVMQPLSKESITTILNIKLKDLTERIEEAGYKIKISKEANEKLNELAFDEKYGARHIDRILQKEIENKILDFIIGKKSKKGSTLNVSLVESEIVIK